MSAVLTPKEYNQQVKEKIEEREEKYAEQEDGSFLCRECEERVLAALIAHPIWDGPFPHSGSGNCHYEQVPYCPNCEDKPEFSSGAPIAPPGSYHHKEKVN